jgi:probable LLM family oxidoreductase
MDAMQHDLELGLDTFGDVTVAGDGSRRTEAQVIRDVIEEGVFADQVGAHFFGVGEHHRDDFAVSAPEVVLAAIAGRTQQIRLGSAVTVLSSDDPVRVFQRFATVDAASNGRAEAILGRGSFVESFALFGYELDQYETLFEEKLDLFVQLLREQPVTWRGSTRAALEDQQVYPRTESGLKAWVGVGGSPQSVVRAARHELPLMLAIIGGDSARFLPFVELYRRALAEFGSPVLPVGVHSPGHIAETDELAREQLYPYFKQMRDRIGAERGWGPMSRVEFEHSARPGGSLYVGSPETVAQKIAATAGTLGLSRFDMKYSHGQLPHDLMMNSIELYGTKVIPRVHELMAEAGHDSARRPSTTTTTIATGGGLLLGE